MMMAVIEVTIEMVTTLLEFHVVHDNSVQHILLGGDHKWVKEWISMTFTTL